MERDEILKELGKLKSLTMDQIARVRDAAIADVKKQIGDEPVMNNYMVNISIRRLLEPLDYLLIVFFLALIALSVLHIFVFGRHLIEATTSASEFVITGASVGIIIPQQIMAWVTQIGLLVMAETGSLGFSIRNAKRNAKRKDEIDQMQGVVARLVSRYVHFDFFASAICAFLAIVYNVHALTYQNYNSPDAGDQFFYGMGWLIGIFIPILVIYLGEHFAEMFIRLDAARQEALELYYVDIHNWREWNQNPDTFDMQDGVNSYRNFFSNRLVEHYKLHIAPRLKDVEVAWSPEVERYLAARERANMRRMNDLDELENFFVQGDKQVSPQPGSENSQQPSENS